MAEQHGGDDIRDALVRQWRAIAAAVPTIDLDAPSRIDSWRNRDVVAHLCIQPGLLGRFLRTASTQQPTMGLVENLSGTYSLAELIDSAARKEADRGRVDFARAVDEVLPVLRAADLAATVVTVQGPIALVDYLVTRCVEGVVHGGDLVAPVEPDPVARALTAHALLDVLSERARHLVPTARALSPPVWIDVATGRRPCFGDLAAAVPVMS